MPTSGLSEHDIGRLVQEAVDMAEFDVARRSLVDVKNRAESLLYSSERALAELGGLLDPDELAQISAEIAEAKAVIEVGQLAEVEAAVDRLEQAAQRIGEAIYATAEDGSGGATAGGGKDGG